jgi:hypothetical protein
MLCISWYALVFLYFQFLRNVLNYRYINNPKVLALFDTFRTNNETVKKIMV